MDPFRTVIEANVSKHALTLQDRVITTGSCFSDAIGNKLSTHKVHTMVNPFGAVYNPHSIHKALRYALLNEMPSQNTFLQHHDLHLNYDFHSALSSLSEAGLVSMLRDAIGNVHRFLKDASFLIITYGTAWIYTHTQTGEIVANCHKTPSKNFTRSLLTQKKIIESFGELYDTLKSFNTSVKIVLTISPVRHIKDTLQGNSVSKSILRASCHTLTEIYPEVEYFPAFEVMMDDLRDYRFYKPDKIHPSEEAEEYIWDRFKERYLSSETIKFFSKWKNILMALQHKPFHPASSDHQHFLRATLQKLEELKPVVNVENEINMVRQRLIG